MPRPEFESFSERMEVEKSSHPCMNQNHRDVKFEELMLRIKKYILDNSVRSREFFEKFDKMRRGFVTKSQFVRALEGIGVSGLSRLYIASDDVKKVIDEYEDKTDPDRVNWGKFCDDIDEVFTIK